MQVQVKQAAAAVKEKQQSLRNKITDAVAATATRIAGISIQHYGLLARGLADRTGGKAAAVVPEPVPEAQQAKWDELMPTVLRLALVDAPEMRGSLLDLIDKLAEFNPSILKPHYAECKGIIQRGLKDYSSMHIRMAALRACISLLLSLEEQQRSALQDCVPLLFDVLGSAFASTDDETMVACVERLGELAAVSPKFLKAHVQPILEAMVHVVKCTTLESETRRAAMNFLLTLVEEGKSMVRKGADFARQVIPLAFNFLQEIEHNPSEWDRAVEGAKLEDEDGGEGQENYRFGCECISRLSDSLGGKTFLTVIEPLISAAIQPTQEWNVRHAGLVSIGHMAYGVQQHMYKQLPVILQKFVLPSALHDPHPRVRWAAIEVCALLSDAFEPDFANDFHKEVFTVLMASLEGNNHWRVIAHACLCFPDFCRGLDRENLTE